MRRCGSLIFGVVLLGHSSMAQEPPTAHYYFSKSSTEPAAKWGYSGLIGPTHWGELDPSYRMASNGKHQSPINIKPPKESDADLPELKFDYRLEQLATINNGHTIQHNESPGSFLHVGDKKYALEQFHVHTPSEHTLEGKQFDLEIHFVHKSNSGEVAVVSVLVQGDEKSVLDFPLYNDLPNKSGESVAYGGSRNPSDFLPRSRDYFSYSGSFTTPPCTEGVRWIVMTEPIGVPPQIIERFAAILKSNNRPIQMLNDRIVKKSE